MHHLSDTTTPTGAYIEQRDAMQPAFTDNSFEQVFSAANLQRAWKQVRANKGAAGVDGMTIEKKGVKSSNI